MSSKCDLSVVVCCYNSRKLLSPTLEHIAAQKLKRPLKAELILVDNNSDDGTASFARSFWDSLNTNLSLKIVSETKPGLAHARKKGLENSNGDILVFCDDDNWLNSDYLHTAYLIMTKNPSIGALGGETLGVLEGAQPEWWQDEMSNYAVGKQWRTAGDISHRGYVWGAGLVVRREILERLYRSGFKSLLLGRTEKAVTSGDDSEYCKWVLLMGYKLWYSDKLQLKHYITLNRISSVYLDELKTGHFDSHKILEIYDWFIKMCRYKDLKNLNFNDKLLFLKQAIKGCVNGDANWRRKLQIVFGPFFPIDRNLATIQKLYEKI